MKPVVRTSDTVVALTMGLLRDLHVEPGAQYIHARPVVG